MLTNFEPEESHKTKQKCLSAPQKKKKFCKETGCVCTSEHNNEKQRATNILCVPFRDEIQQRMKTN